MTNTLLALAAKGREKQAEGKTHAAKAIQGEVLTPEDRAFIQQLADGGDEDARRELDALDSGEIAIFGTAFGRKAYLEEQIAAMANAETLDLSSVISLLFKIQSKTMPGVKSMMPAIPILTSYTGYTEARKHHQNPIVIANSSRKSRRGKNETIESRGFLFLVPATTLDHGAFGQMRSILKRAAETLIERLDNCEKMTVRQAVWLALHFVPRSMMVSPQWRDRIYEVRDGELFPKGKKDAYVFFALSENEIFVARKSPVTVRLISQFKAMAES